MKKDIFWIGIGDIHENLTRLNDIKNLPDAEGVLLVGDITNAGGKDDAARILNAIGSVNPNIHAIIGNMDTQAVHNYLTRENLNVHARVVDLGHGVALMGAGYSIPTPFGTPSEVSDTQLGQWLDATYEEVEGYDHLILMVHTPPYGTLTDRVHSGQSVGSHTVRAFIEETQPDVCFTGHIHEAKSVDQIGKTRIINPGLFSKGGYVLIRLTASGLEAELKQC